MILVSQGCGGNVKKNRRHPRREATIGCRASARAAAQRSAGNDATGPPAHTQAAAGCHINSFGPKCRYNLESRGRAALSEEGLQGGYRGRQVHLSALAARPAL